MPALLDLPVEILHAIVLELNGSDRKSLRSTCNGLSTVVEPFLFSEITINTHCSVLETVSLPFCKALALSPSEDGVVKDERTLSTYVRTLSVQDRALCTGDDNASQEMLDVWQGVFTSALSSLVNLGTFRWEMSKNSPSWMYAQVPEIVSRLPLLSEFFLVGKSIRLDYLRNLRTVVIDGIFLAGESVTGDVNPPSIRLDYLRNLRTLIIDGIQLPEATFSQTILGPLSTALLNSPDLQTLHVRAPFQHSTSFSFSDVFRGILDTKGASVLNIKTLVVEQIAMDVPAVMIPHLQCLSSLEVHTGGQDMEVGNFWDVLRAASVSLEVLKVYGDIDRTLLDYISHCHSRLKVLRLSGAARKATDEISNELADNELADLFFDSVLPEFTQSLRELRIGSSYKGRWCLGPHNVDMFSRCSNLETLSVCFNGKEGIVNMIDDIVNRAYSLPKLKSLHLGMTTATWGRGDRCGIESLEYRSEIRSAYRDAFKNLQPTEAQDARRVPAV
ncbi:hypothetical protein D9758_011396 [Tetrapyrgos nigripes]|uniref:F-box domain-containing protein n=1 Tax=Tetrapyrgos nigripes TaxID=182062 RepID=A0A8H5CQE0_9AGAR|nr:hypothetical protein D9758_011396 [Tetrapyrgos nigripes]